MRRAFALAALAALVGCGAAPEPATSDRTPLKVALVSQNITLPDNDRRFPEPGGTLLNRNCLACHSADMLLYQPRLTEAQWRATIEKMRDAYHAPIAEADIDGLIAELGRLRNQH